jgi:hypothetical protein
LHSSSSYSNFEKDAKNKILSVFEGENIEYIEQNFVPKGILVPRRKQRLLPEKCDCILSNNFKSLCEIRLSL